MSTKYFDEIEGRKAWADVIEEVQEHEGRDAYVDSIEKIILFILRMMFVIV